MTKRLKTASEVLEELELDVCENDEPMTAGSDDEFDDESDIDDDDSEAEIACLPRIDLPNYSIPDADHVPCTHAPETSESAETCEHATNETDLLRTDPDPISAAKTPARNRPNWTNTLTPLTISSFQSPVGPSVPIPDSPSATFRLIFTPSLIEQIVQQSNLYAQQVMEPGKFEQWKNISSIELEAYLGFSMLMGINSLPSLDDYWSTDPALHYYPIADKISRDRFREISRYLHFQDNSKLLQRGSPGYDRLGKVRPIIDHIDKCFPSLYILYRDTSVDEAMVKYTGRSTLK